MKKKLAVLLAAAMLTLGAAANAMAYWADGDLIRVVYNHGGTVEVATDLGSIASIQGGAAPTADAFSLSQVTGATSFADLYVAYFAKNYSGGQAWVASDPATAPVTGSRKFNNLNTAANNVFAYYQTLGAGSTVIGSQSNGSSYYSLLTNAGAGYGQLNQYIPLGVEQNLAALATGGSVTQTLYTFNGQTGTSGATTGVAVNGPSSVLQLTTNANGISTSNASTPIPPSFLLMGSGLIGMVGIRRRMAA